MVIVVMEIKTSIITMIMTILIKELRIEINIE